MKVLKSIGNIVFHTFIYCVSFIIHKDRKIWVFGAWAGRLFSDNSKHLYDYVRENHKDIKAVWITKNRSLAQEMQKKGLPCFYYNSLQGAMFSVRAAVFFTVSGMEDVAGEWAHRGCLHVELCHGSPIKKIGRDNTGWKKLWKKSVEEPTVGQRLKKCLPYYSGKYHNRKIYTVSSEEVKRKFETAFAAEENQIFVTGQPRNDVFVRRPNSSYMQKLKDDHPGVKVICYLPTHRNFGTKNNNPLTQEVMIETDEFCRNHNIILIIKPHFHERKHYLDMFSRFTNIIIGVDEEVFSDPYGFLPFCDGLISDYSSVFLDFLCSGRPVILFPYDMDDYISDDAGLYYDYHDIAPGAICYSWEEVLEAVVKEIRRTEPTEQYKKVFELFNRYNDGRNCERIYKLVTELLEGTDENA